MGLVIAVLTQTGFAQGPSDLIHITSFGRGGGMKMVGGYATIPLGAQSDLCHLSLCDVDDRCIARWFGEAGCTKIRFEITLPSDQFKGLLLKLSDHPLSIKSMEELQRRPGSTFAQIKIDEWPITPKHKRP